MNFDSLATNTISFLKLPGLKVFLRLLLTCVIISYIIMSISFESLKIELSNANIFLLTLAFIPLFGRVPIMAWRWQVILNIKGSQYTLGKLTKYYFIGFFFNNFLPTSIGGDLTRGISLARQKITKETIVSSILMERLLGIVALLLIGFISYLICWNNGSIQSDVLSIAGKCLGIGCLAGLTMLLVPLYASDLFFRLQPSHKMFQKLISIINNFAEYWVKPLKVLLALLITVFCQAFGIFAIYLISISTHQHTAFIYFSFLLPIIWLASMLPVSIGGLGVREGSFIFLFGVIGMNLESAVAISVLWLALSYVQSLIGGFIFLVTR